MIPVTGSNVDLSLLHPRFVKRLEAFFRDPQIIGRVMVSSACRSYATQKKYYDKYKAGRGNLAANPDRRFGTGGWWRGSWHMSQDDGFCYAVDLHMVSNKIAKWEVNNIATRYGVVPTIKAREWWHHQPRNAEGWFDAPALSESKDDKVEIKPDFLGILAYIAACAAQVAAEPLSKRRKSRGPIVSTLQERIIALGIFRTMKNTGVFSWRCHWAIKKFQRMEGLTRDGCVGPQTWERLWNPEFV